MSKLLNWLDLKETVTNTAVMLVELASYGVDLTNILISRVMALESRFNQ